MNYFYTNWNTTFFLKKHKIMCSRPNTHDYNSRPNMQAYIPAPEVDSPPPSPPDYTADFAMHSEHKIADMHNRLFLAEQRITVLTTENVTYESDINDLKETFMCYKNFTQERVNNLERLVVQFRNQLASLQGHTVKED